jgi:hypothetical protein
VVIEKCVELPVALIGFKLLQPLLPLSGQSQVVTPRLVEILWFRAESLIAGLIPPPRFSNVASWPGSLESPIRLSPNIRELPVAEREGHDDRGDEAPERSAAPNRDEIDR